LVGPRGRLGSGATGCNLAIKGNCHAHTRPAPLAPPSLLPRIEHKAVLDEFVSKLSAKGFEVTYLKPG